MPKDDTHFVFSMFFSRRLCTQGPQATPAHPSAQPTHTCLGTRLPVNDKNMAASAKKSRPFEDFYVFFKTALKIQEMHFRDPKLKTFTGGITSVPYNGVDTYWATSEIIWAPLPYNYVAAWNSSSLSHICNNPQTNSIFYCSLIHFQVIN